MRKNNSHGLNKVSLSKNKAQDTKNYAYLKFIRREVAKKSGFTFEEFLLTYSNAQRYRYGLKHFTTTNKAICEALFIPVEAGTRYKRTLEKEGHLMASRKKQICPYTKHLAHFLSTDSNQFNDLLK